MEEDVEAVLVFEELDGGGADGGQVGEVEEHGDEVAFAVGVVLLEGGDGGVEVGLGAGGEVDFGVLGVEHAGELVAYACGGAGDDVDLGDGVLVGGILRVLWKMGGWFA